MKEKLIIPGKRLLFENSSSVSLLDTCTSIKQALQTHAQIIVNGFHHHIFTLSRLISFFALSGSQLGLDYSRRLFSQIDQPNIFIWNTMIRGYSRSEFPQESILLFKSMIAQGIVSPNNFTFPFLLNSCAKLSCIESGKEIHSHIIKNGFDSDLFIRNSLIHLYSTFRELDYACTLFDESPDRDLVSFNTMINGYARGGQPSDALHLFGEMRVFGIGPDEFTIVALLSACSSLGDRKTGKQIHLLVYKNLNFDGSNVLLKTALIDMYAKCGLMEMADRVFSNMGTHKSTAAWSSMISGYVRSGEIEIAQKIFNQMGERDLVSWTAMISGYAQMGKYNEALELFVEMENFGIKPDEVTLATVLSACARLGALDFGKRLHQQYIESGFYGHNPIVVTAIVDMYAKCGSIETAVNIFHGVQGKSKTVFLFNVIISGLAQHGLGKSAINFFQEMELAGLRPDEVTFVGILCACSHGGLIEEGKKIFNSMLKNHGIKPETEHYCCMVDLLGRNGHLKEAYDFIQKMPFEGNSVIWRSFLGACKIHGNVEMGEIAGKRLLELEPDHGARYVLLSNMFTDANRWEDARKIRKVMEERGIQKPPGWSYIELNGTLHRFVASDKSHPQSKEIELRLEDITRRLKLAGYVPDTAGVLFDIDEEEKETVVSYHSEKLALAFGLINLGPETTIRIVKNLRICWDCHSAFKLFSEIYGREVVVRDTIRFHHFNNGFCSCKDYW
ncbi:Pentatricopeptide repeat [Macleaya cordata]|uniref:Pentatricopeptide repeat n=1 Tax=Macleaya cordata TaxID=56857 RepID=A0A200R5K8_MACCD|nr:Pentatricopeptide repeat [Macleaya cordata]